MPLLCNRPLPKSQAESLEDEARLRLAAGDSESWAFIVPNRIAQRRIERELLNAKGASGATGRAVSELHILTLADLAGVLAAQAFPELKHIGDAEGAVLIELSIRELSNAHQLDFFERAGSIEAAERAFPVPRGTFELILNTIRQLKESGVAPATIERDLRLLRASGKETTESRRAADLLAIYEAYQERLRMRFMDTYGQVLLANERYDTIEGGNFIDLDFRKAFPKVHDLFISGFYYLERPSITLIAKLGEVEGIQVSIKLEESQSNPDLFAGLIELESQLIEHGFIVHDRVERPVNNFASFLGHWLFRAAEIPSVKAESSGIELASAHDPLAEVEGIARRIKLIYESDPDIRGDLSRIVVATPTPEIYTPLIEEVFRRHEIPVEIADRYHLDRAPLVLAVLSLVEMARTGLRKRDLLRALSSPYFDFAAAGPEPFDARNLRDVLSHHRLSGNAEALLATLAALRGETEKQKFEAEASEEFARQEARIRQMDNAMRDIRRILRLTRPLRVELTPSEFCAALREMLRELHAPERILASSDVTIGAGTLELDTRAYRSFVKLLEELESLFHLMGTSTQERKVEYYEQRLKAALMLRRYSARPRSRAVLVTTLAQSISQPAEYLFLAGLTEGAFPAPYEPQVFLTAHLQKGERKQRLEERVLFYQSVINFKKRLYLSHPRKSSGGAEINRSSFLDNLEEVVPVTTSEMPEGIFSYRELHPVAELIPQAMLDPLIAVRPHVQWLIAMREQAPRARLVIRARRGIEDTIHRGRVDPTLLRPGEAAALEANKARVWSVTQLERYANCPFHFFARDVLGLGVDEEQEEGLDARDKGSALHEILRQFLISRREQRPIADVPEQEMNAVYEDARHIAERYFYEIGHDHPFWRLDAERLLSDEQPGGNIFRRFIDRERELGEYRLRPRFFEVSFGGAGRAEKSPHDPELSREEPVNLGGFQLRGKIDRIDLTQENDGTIGSGLFNIIDYKSGKNIPSWKEMEERRSLQLPLYLRVAEDLLRSHYPELEGVAAAAALYQKLAAEDAPRKLGLAVKSYENAFEKLRGKGLLQSPEELKEFVDQTIAKAKQYVDGVAAGQFPLARADLLKQCNYCAFGTVCRIEEAKEAGVLR